MGYIISWLIGWVLREIIKRLEGISDMSNFGFISKNKVAREIAKIYNEHNNTPCPKEQFMGDCEAQSALNLLCKKLGIKPMHLNKLGGGTGEMIGGMSDVGSMRYN